MVSIAMHSAVSTTGRISPSCNLNRCSSVAIARSGNSEILLARSYPRGTCAIGDWEEQRHNSKFDNKMDLSILVKSQFHSAYFRKSISAIAASSKLTRERELQ